jgi:hypothetical protein
MQCASTTNSQSVGAFSYLTDKKSNLLKIASISKSVRSCSLLFGHVNANRNFSIPWPSRGQKRAFAAVNIIVLVYKNINIGLIGDRFNPTKGENGNYFYSIT